LFKTFLSLRYLRTRRTNWIGVSGIFVAVAALIMILSIMAGFLQESRDTLRGSLSDLIVQPRFDTPGRDGRPLLKDGAKTLEIVRADPRVAAACLELQWFGLLTMEGRQMILSDPMMAGMSGVHLVGIDVEDELATTDLRAALEAPPRVAVQRVVDVEDPFRAPPTFDPGDDVPRPRVVVGEQLASRWGMSWGDEITIGTAVFDPQTGEPSDYNSMDFQVAGTFRSKENEADLGRIYLDRRDLADLLGLDADYNTVLVRLHDYERHKRAVVADLRERLAAANLLHPPDSSVGRWEVLTWEDFRRNLLAAIQNEKALMGVMLSLVLVVAGFTVFAILSMMVSEKRRDIGILCALGSTSRGVLALFLMIGAWEAVVGAGLGTLAGILGATYIDSIELWLSSTFGIQIFDRGVYLFDHIPHVIDPLGVALIVLGAVVCTLAFAALPAWRASRLNPIDALRYE